MPDQTGPLTFQQRQIWLAEHGVRGSSLYNEAHLLSLCGSLNITALERALGIVVGRHESLRASFPIEGGEPVQRIHSPPLRRIIGNLVDFSSLTAGERLEVAMNAARRIAEEEFDVQSGPLFRCALLKVAADHHLLLLNVHHMVCDAWSMRLVTRDVWDAYDAILRGTMPDHGPGPSYGDYVRLQHDESVRGSWEADLSFWQSRLTGAPAVAELPGGPLRPPAKAHEGKRDQFRFDDEARACLSSLQGWAFGSKTAALIAIFGALFYKYTGRTDLIVGTPVSCRPPEFDSTVGMFVNMLPIRLGIDGTMTASRLVEQTADAYFDAVDHSAVPFERVVEVLQTPRDPSYPPLVQVVCAVSDEEDTREGAAGLEGTPISIPRGRARFDLLIEHEFGLGSEWTVHAEYDTALFEPLMVARLMRHYERLITAAARGPRDCLASLDMVGPDERRELSRRQRVVLDRDGNVLPVGAVGRVHLRSPDEGELVATGHFGRNGLDGMVEDLGLVSRRVSIGQVEVQLEQIEGVLREHPSVSDAGVALRPDGAGLIAYVALEDVPLPEIWDFLRTRLPRAQLPKQLIPTGSITRDQNGDPAVTYSDIAHEEARVRSPSALEDTLLDVWRDVLGDADIDPDDDFFGIGGNSMIAARIAERIGVVVKSDVSVRLIFEYPTVAELAAAIATGHTTPIAADEGPDACLANDRADRVPMAAAQLQIWLNEQFTQGARADFNVSFAGRLRGKLDAEALRAAFCAAVIRHPSFGSWLEPGDELPMLRFGAQDLIDLPITDLTGLPEALRPEEARRLAMEIAGQEFNIEEPPLLRVGLLRLAAEDHVLAYAMHHLVTDGVSSAIFHRDLAELYNAHVQAVQPILPAPVAHYADYVEWERKWFASEAAQVARDYWTARLAGWRDLSIPASRDKRGSLAVAAARRTFSALQSAEIEAFSRASRSTTFMTVTAAWAAVLHDWSGEEDILFGTLVDNRPLEIFRGIAGCFANFVPLRIICDGDTEFGNLAARARDAILGAYEHQHVPLAEIVQLARAPRSLTRMPLFRTTIQNSPIAAGDMLRLPGLEAEPWTVNAAVSRFELSLFVTEDGPGLTLDLEYATDLWDRDEIEARVDQLAEVLRRGAREPGKPLASILP